MADVASPEEEPVRVLLTTGVWGDAYIDKFLAISLPSQLAEGNLQGAPWLGDSRFLIVTSSAGRERLEEAPAIRQLASLIETEIRVLEEIDRPGWRASKYHLMNLCQMEAISAARDFDALMFGYADTIWASGALQNAAARIEEGYDGVFAPGLPVCEEAFVKTLRTTSSLWKEDGEAASLCIPPRSLVHLTLQMLHPMASANFRSRPVFGSSPSYTLWDVPGQGVALRAFHLHPVMVRTQPGSERFLRRFTTSLDEEYVSNLFPSKDHLYFAHDSDELALCSLMQPFPHGFETDPPVRPSARAQALWAEAHASALHREFYEEEYRLHYAEVVPRDWLPASREGAGLVRRVRARLAIPDSLLQVEDPQAAEARRGRVARLRYWQRADYIEPAWLQGTTDAQLARLVLRRSGRAVLKRLNWAARRLGLNLRRTIEHLPSLGLGGFLPRVRWLRRSDALPAVDPALSLSSGYPVRYLARTLIRRLLRALP